MIKAIFSPSAFLNFEEFSRYIAPHISPDDKIITHSTETFAAKFAVKNRVNLEVIFGKKGEENMAFNRAKSIIDAADEVIVYTDLEGSMSLYEVDAALTKGKKTTVLYFGIPMEVNEKPVNFTTLGGCWLRDEFPCEVSYKGVKYESVAAAMCGVMLAACQGHMDNYKDESEIAAMPKTHRDRLVKVMFDLQCQKFGNANAVLRRKLELQKGEIALKGSDFWSGWVSKMVNKIKNETLQTK